MQGTVPKHQKTLHYPYNAVAELDKRVAQDFGVKQHAKENVQGAYVRSHAPAEPPYNAVAEIGGQPGRTPDHYSQLKHGSTHLSDKHYAKTRHCQSYFHKIGKTGTRN